MQSKRRKVTAPTEERRIDSFFEELSWLLDVYKDINVKLLSKRMSSYKNSELSGIAANHSVSDNKQFLVGVLPTLLADESLFQANEDIADFARQVMNVDIPRYHKKSRYELIGHIVCNTNELDENSLAPLVKALAAVLERGDVGKAMLRTKKTANYSWNSIISDLSGAS